MSQSIEVETMKAMLVTDRDFAASFLTQSIKAKLDIVRLQSDIFEIKAAILLVAAIVLSSVLSAGDVRVNLFCYASVLFVAAGLVASNVHRRRQSNAYVRCIASLFTAETQAKLDANSERLCSYLVSFSRSCLWPSNSTSNYAYTLIQRQCDDIKTALSFCIKAKSCQA